MKYRAAWLASIAIVGALYFWIIGLGAVPERFVWEKQVERFYGSPPRMSLYGADAVNGYYELLARSFASRQLRLPVEPLPQLLALPDPWLGVANGSTRLLDVALFNRHYYLYHGPTPVVLFFLPWYLATGRDLPENFAAALIALLAFVVLSKLFREVLSSLEISLWLPLYFLFLIALGTGQAVPFLLHRAKVYEVAIACGLLCISAGFYCVFRALSDSKRAWVWAGCAGLCLGLAVGCRPHLGLASVVVFLLWIPFVRRGSWREMIAYAAPLAACGVLLMVYNYARFHSPFEFGTKYLLGDDRYRNFGISAKNLVAGLYYLLLSPPRVEPEFPFVHMVWRVHLPFAGYVLPPNYFLERISGGLMLCPLIALCPLSPFLVMRLQKSGAAGRVLGAMLAFAIACILFIALVPFSSQRYEVDFLPVLLFVGCVGAAALLRNLGSWPIRWLAGTIIALALLFSMVGNLGLGLQGPYDQFVQRDPRAFVELGQKFSPILWFRPMLGPTMRANATFEFPDCPAQREALISAGELGSRYLLTAQCSGPGRIQLVSESAAVGPGEPHITDLAFAPGSYKIGIEFAPKDGTMTVFWNESPVLRHHVPFLVTSRSQVRFGFDASLGYAENFRGRIQSWPPEVGYLLK